jgi:endonuclease/exonuclease/phosphatase family metal-dependent hydrolase
MRLASFNILHGRAPSDQQVDLDRLADAIKFLDADILALQEVDRLQPRSHGADLTAVAADAMGAVSFRFVAALSGTPEATWMAATEDEVPGEASYGIALLSRYPARSWQVLRLPHLRRRFPMWLPGPRKIIVVREEPRAVVIADLQTPKGTLLVANTHLSFVPGWGMVQLRRIRRDLAAVPGPVLLMGDLNMPYPKPSRLTGYQALATHPTFPAAAPNRQLDHILLRGDLGKVLGSSAPELPLSDHRAIVVDIADHEEEIRRA